ncbi:glutathione S-transferase family protein [Salipiger abyssi]|uniref:glutathione S-transferase family protein n=1 Tax=Salipiger abyssi TaxID=1250539 RepID=UPI001A8CBF5D|nr:glutathione S-transferase family protein [Salipiger abyssi]MBN9887019.1 glutathione S-transferase family protein [Salipiger abyssi]
MITLYGRRNSSNTAKIYWALDALGLTYDLRETGRGYAPTDTPSYRRLHPHGKVPALEVNGGAIWESHSILRYLGAEYDTPLWPTDPVARAQADAWMDWIATALVPPLGRYRKAEDAEKATLFSPVAAAFTALDTRLCETPWIAGETMTLADIAAAPAVHRWFLISAPRPALHGLGAYRDRLRMCEGYRAHVEAALD